MKKYAILFLAFLSVIGVALAQEAEPPVLQDQPAEEGGDAPVPAAPASEHLDIVFAIDASGSVKWTDPDSFRKSVANFIVDITQDKGGDRIAVMQFAGWNETSLQGSTLFNLTQIPDNPQLREVLLTEVKTTVNMRLGAFGKATDFNFAFQRGFKSILMQRDSLGGKNKVWLVLISDGSMEVVEGRDVHEAYRSRLVGQGKDVNRPNLNKAAEEMFIEEVLPEIASNNDLFVTCIDIGLEEPGNVLVKIGELPNGHLVRASEENLKSVFVEAFSKLPESYPEFGISKGFDYVKSEIAPDSVLSRPFHVYQGTTATHLLVMCSSRDFAIDINDSKGTRITDDPGVTVLGGGDSYRLVSLTSENYGDYTLQVSNKSGSPVAFEFLQYIDLDLAPFVSTAGLKGEFYPGETLSFETGLRENKTSTFVTDPVLISQAEVMLQVRDVDGNISESNQSFPDPQNAKTLAEYALPTDAPGGEWELLVRVAAIKNTVSGRHAFLSRPVSIPFSVLSPVVELGFAQTEVLMGQSTKVIGGVKTGSLTEKQMAEGIRAKAVHTASLTEKDVLLEWNKETEELSGTIVLDEKDEWSILEMPLGTGRIKPSQPGRILVKPRGLRVAVVDSQGNKTPVDRIKLKGQVGESTCVNLLIEGDLAPGEAGEISAVFGKVMDEAEVVPVLAGKTGEPAGITGENPVAPLALTLELKSKPEKGEVGELTITANLSGVVLEKRIAVETEVPAARFPWLYVVIVAGVLVVLLIVLLGALSGPTFDRQQLYIVGGTGHLLKEWKTGRKNAVGTAEVPGTMLFRLKGGKAQPKCMVMPDKKARVFVNNIESTYWTEVHHGDFVEMYPAESEYSYRYRYFERAPTSGELQAFDKVTEQIGEGVFLGEDEFILADDDDLGGAPGDATQALLEQARRMKERMESEATEILVHSAPEEMPAEPSADEWIDAGEMELLEEAAATKGEQEFTEAVPSIPDEPTEAIISEGFEEVEEPEATQAIGEGADAFFEEITSAQSDGDGLGFAVSEDVELSEPTEAIGEEMVFEEMEGEATQAIVPDADDGGDVGEPTEEMPESEPMQDLTDLVEERLEMSEFIEDEGETDDKAGMDLADELDKTFDQILGEEEDKNKDL